MPLWLIILQVMGAIAISLGTGAATARAALGNLKVSKETVEVQRDTNAITGLSNLADRAESERNRLTVELNQVHQEMALKDQQILTLNQTNQHLQEQLTSVTRESEENKRKLAEASQQIAGLVAENTSLRNMLDAQGKQLLEQSARLAALEARINRRKTPIKKEVQ